jgi:hypothetical protein
VIENQEEQLRQIEATQRDLTQSIARSRELVDEAKRFLARQRQDANNH